MTLTSASYMNVAHPTLQSYRGYAEGVGAIDTSKDGLYFMSQRQPYTLHVYTACDTLCVYICVASPPVVVCCSRHCTQRPSHRRTASIQHPCATLFRPAHRPLDFVLQCNRCVGILSLCGYLDLVCGVWVIADTISDLA